MNIETEVDYHERVLAKVFHAYTNSVVRSIDERIMQRASLI